MRELLSKVESVTVAGPVTALPRIKVLSVPADMDPSDVETELKASHARLLRTSKRGPVSDFIYEVDKETFNRLKGTRVYLPSLTVCRVVACDDVPMCTNCLGPGHSASKCLKEKSTEGPLCARCGERGHAAKDCSATAPCCHNCKQANRRVTNHSAFDQKKCPFIKKVAARRNTLINANNDQ